MAAAEACSRGATLPCPAVDDVTGRAGQGVGGIVRRRESAIGEEDGVSVWCVFLEGVPDPAVRMPGCRVGGPPWGRVRGCLLEKGERQ